MADHLPDKRRLIFSGHGFALGREGGHGASYWLEYAEEYIKRCLYVALC
ncbi:hypothetical protein KVC_2641 [Ketogulonicigenium vulgare]|nr:hypothetical protein KVC_2641 [Ketogulonicigenium vulgare]